MGPEGAPDTFLGKSRGTTGTTGVWLGGHGLQRELFIGHWADVTALPSCKDHCKIHLKQSCYCLENVAGMSEQQCVKSQRQPCVPIRSNLHLFFP